MIRAESFSSIQTFLRCPKAYENRYILKMKQEPSFAMKRGSDIHEEISSNKEETEQALYAKKFYKRTDKNEYVNLANPGECVQNLFECHFGIKRKEDKEFEFCKFDDESCFFRGVADLVTLYYKKTIENPIIEVEKIKIIDWKTGKSSGDRKQLLSYALCLYYMLDVEKIEAQFVYLDQERESKKYFFNKEDIESIEKEIKRDIEIIQNTSSFEARENWTCNGCNHKKNCDLFKPLKEEKNLSNLIESL